MNSTIILYYNSLIEKDKNFILDHWVSSSQRNPNAILLYLNTLEKDTIDNFQYVKQALSVTIKLDMSQTSLNMGSNDGVKDLNYVSIQNGNEKVYYYFVISKNWKSANTIELVLSMDTLNTFMYDADYEISPKTLIKRMHRDRFKYMVRSHRIDFEGTSGESIVLEFTNTDFVHSSIKSMSYTSEYSITGGTLSTFTSNYKKYIRFTGTLTHTGPQWVWITYYVNALETIIDLKSEEINVPVYKRQDEQIIYEKDGYSKIDWSLYYKTANNQETTPVDCYLVPSEPMSFYYQQASGEFNTGNIPSNKYLLFFVAYNDPPITFDIDGVTYTPSRSYESYYSVTSFRAIALFNDSGTIKVYEGSFNNYQGPRGGWHLISTHPNSIKVINSPEKVYSNEVASLPNPSTIYNNQIYMNIYAQHETEMGALIETTIYGNNEIDKTLSTNIKIINIPYSPTPFEIDENNIFTFDACWEYNSGDGKLKLIDFNNRFKNEVETAIASPLEVFSYNLYQHINLWEDVSRTIADPKLMHSDYYRPKFVYDSFSKIFPLEQINYEKSSKDINLKFDFIMSRNIVSKFLFMFNQFKYKYAKEDYENIVAVSRNNEEVLYNSQYLDYIRTGYNYDLKAKERTEVASGIGIGLNVAGLIASIGIGIATQNPLAIAGVVGTSLGLAGQLVNYAKTTAQNEENIQKKLQETQMQAVSVMNADDYDLLYAYSQNKAKWCIYECSERMQEVLDDLFFYCGYVVNEQGKPNIHTRRSFNFVQASLVVNQTTNLTLEIQEDIQEKFEQGVTFLHYSFNKFDFNQDKENIELAVLPYYTEE